MRIKKINDLKVIQNLHKEIFGLDFSIDNFKEREKRNPILIFVYEEKNELIGYSLVIDEIEQKNYYAWYGGVKGSYQGKKSTPMCFKYLIQYARKNNYKSVSVATHNNKPHMLILAIKMGFDIYNIKIRNDENGNKIYFKYYINKENSKSIDLDKYSFIDIEHFIVKTYKENCNKYIIKKCSDSKKLLYFINYCFSLEFKPTIIINKSIYWEVRCNDRERNCGTIRRTDRRNQLIVGRCYQNSEGSWSW